MTDDSVSDQWRLPDLERCLTKHLEHSLEFSVCLVKTPDSCEYARHIGSSIFCQHPDRRSFETADLP
jgi:hypothetical protein